MSDDKEQSKSVEQAEVSESAEETSNFSDAVGCGLCSSDSDNDRSSHHFPTYDNGW